MKPAPFRLERYFAEHEFSAAYLLCCSDAEPLLQRELLDLADSETLGLWRELALGYTESAGHPLLRQEIAKLYGEASPEDVLVLAPEEGIYAAMNVLLGPGDRVVTTFPGYQSLYAVAEAIGCRVDRWAPRIEESHWRFRIEDLEPLLTSATQLLVINFPHNPTGATISRGEMRELLHLARDRGVRVFSDEMYRLLEHSESQRLDPACDRDVRALSLGGLSKAYALPGLRIGWLVTLDRTLHESLAAFKDYTTICSSAPSELLALMALRAGTSILDRNRAIVSANLATIGAFMARWRSRLEWLPPQGGTIAFPRLLGRTPVTAFCERLLRDQGVLLLPGDVYDVPGNHFRLGYGRRNLPEALDRLEHFLTQNPV